MKRITLLIAAFTFILTSAIAQEKQIDINSSKITWLGKKVTGEHTGHIKFKSAKLKWDKKNLKGGMFEVDMNSITCTDIENQDYNAKLVGHLKSDDFFSVDKYPLSVLKLTKVEGSKNGYKAEGNLTIKGKNHPVAFDIKQDGNVLKGKITIDRTKYDVRYGSGKFFDNLGDKMIYDDFELMFKVMLFK